MPVYHLEIRRFPRTLSRFNLSGPEIGAIVLPWVQERVIELEDQHWSPHESTLTILEGPEIPVEHLSMGRGWRTALREGQDVTKRILSEAQQALADSAAGGPQGRDAAAPPTGAGPQPAGEAVATGDQLALGVELARLLGDDPVGLLAAWRAVAARSSGLSPSESLARAEQDLDRGDGRAA